MARTIRILSIDGGGIRGIIPGMVLVDIERRTGRPISQLFDYIAGTSTGGILALGLTRAGADGQPSFSASDGVRLYKEEGHRIFARPVWHRVRSANSLFDQRYPNAGMESVLDEIFGEARLKDALTDVLITAYEIERRIPWFFRSSRAKVNPDYDFPIKQVARATSAAPTYFEPCFIQTQASSEYYALVDGGVFANNPTLCAFVDMHTLYPDSDFLVVSLGTGELTRPCPYDDACGWGLVDWVRPIIDILMHGVSETVDYQMRQLLPYVEGGVHRYYRFQARLSEGNDNMDDCSRTNIRVLQLIGEELVHDNAAALDRLCHALLSAEAESA